MTKAILNKDAQELIIQYHDGTVQNTITLPYKINVKFELDFRFTMESLEDLIDLFNKHVIKGETNGNTFKR